MIGKAQSSFQGNTVNTIDFTVHSVLCSQDLKVKAAEQKSLIDFIESCVEKMQLQFEDSVTQKLEPRYKITKSLPKFGYVKLSEPAETFQWGTFGSLKGHLPLDKKKLQDPGDFCYYQSREMESHLCDSLLDIGLTSVFSQSWYQAELKLKHSQPEASWVSLFSAMHLAALCFGGICNRNYFYTRSLTNLVLFILLQYLPF